MAVRQRWRVAVATEAVPCFFQWYCQAANSAPAGQHCMDGW